MERLVRVEKNDGTTEMRGWMRGEKRQGLWIEKTERDVRIAIYDDGNLKTEEVINTNTGTTESRSIEVRSLELAFFRR
jgi:hypothetical protein